MTKGPLIATGIAALVLAGCDAPPPQDGLRIVRYDHDNKITIYLDSKTLCTLSVSWKTGEGKKYCPEGSPQ